jgi:hypothetical protein
MRAFETLGYRKCETAAPENGMEKVAFYVGSDGKPAHAARQLPNGSWTSKLGRAIDIEHMSIEGVVSNEYGTPQVFMSRVMPTTSSSLRNSALADLTTETPQGTGLKPG